ncbi:hypothetical protein GGR33_000596 [Methylobacterium brachythecii]|uniref:Uncharacterized protein n=1 Tax=Methylobacterium brachythecii TaxID=1176177 RepID=A0A7W6F5Q5_9HYPH|nr:hypothetical protein [Methylobacterium brachythecii]
MKMNASAPSTKNLVSDTLKSAGRK